MGTARTVAGGVAIVHSTATRAGARSASLRAALAAAVLGLAIVWTVGFAPLSALHNAAHDTRHSAAFPCH